MKGSNNVHALVGGRVGQIAADIIQPGEARGLKRLIVTCEFEGQMIKKLQIESILENHDY